MGMTRLHLEITPNRLDLLDAVGFCKDNKELHAQDQEVQLQDRRTQSQYFQYQ